MSDIEREGFEQAVTDRWSDRYSFTRLGDEDYYDEVLEAMWWAWQASREAPVAWWDGDSEAFITRKQAEAVQASRRTLEGDGVRGYSYELARSIENGKYCDFALHISRQKPSVPVGSIRNLEPLYTHPASAAKQAVSVPKQWRDTMEELAADLESEIENRRSGDLDRRIERDLIVVREAKALLAEQEPGQ